MLEDEYISCYSQPKARASQIGWGALAEFPEISASDWLCEGVYNATTVFAAGILFGNCNDAFPWGLHPVGHMEYSGVTYGSDG